MYLKQIAELLKVPYFDTDVSFKHISTDTRTLQPGDLFIAIKGKNFDGHHFIEDAVAKQSAAIISSVALKTALATLIVEDTTKALGQIAAYHRQAFNIPVIGITGSCGKTTTKAILASILSQKGPTLSNKRSFNNEIGVPLTLLELNKDHQYAVIEMGTNHFGEISYLTQIAKPTITLITNAAAAHLEGLESVEGVSRAKGEIFEGLPEDGIAVINADDQYADFWKKLVSSKKIITFGQTDKADVYAKDIHTKDSSETQFILVTPAGEIQIDLPLMGEHNIANATAAGAIAYALSLPLDAIRNGIKATEPVDHRLNRYTGYQGAHIIDDSYNANPLSFKAAIHTLAKQTGKKILVSGDMKELGQHAKDYHKELGEEAKALGIEAIYAYGELSKYTADGFGKNAQYFLDQQQLIDTLKPVLDDHTTVLIKGSLSMHMSRVVKALCE